MIWLAFSSCEVVLRSWKKLVCLGFLAFSTWPEVCSGNDKGRREALTEWLSVVLILQLHTSRDPKLLRGFHPLGEGRGNHGMKNLLCLSFPSRLSNLHAHLHASILLPDWTQAALLWLLVFLMTGIWRQEPWDYGSMHLCESTSLYIPFSGENWEENGQRGEKKNWSLERSRS